MRAKRIFAALLSGLLLLSSSSLPASAEVALPPGAVKGLPERLAALDSDGNAVNSATGEYFFHVEDMQYGVTYSKTVQLMNLREDASYYIYFYVEPLYKAGEIDLEKGCTCTFYLDGREFYKGDVNGKGNIDLSDMYYNTGFYAPGDTHVLKAEVIWDDIDVIQNVDNGHRLIDKNGEHVLVGPGPSGHAEGEIEFKWIFFASIFPVETDVQETTAPTDDYTEDTGTTTTPMGDATDATGTSTSPVDQYTDVTETSTGQATEIKQNTDTEESGSSTASTTETTVTTTTTAPPNDGGFWDSPLTGYLAKDGKPWLIAMGVLSGMIILMLLLIVLDKKKKRDKK